MFGFCEVIVTEQLKIQSIEVYYKPEEFLKTLEGQVSLDNLKIGKSIMGDGCPIVHKQDVKKKNWWDFKSSKLKVSNTVSDSQLKGALSML